MPATSSQQRLPTAESLPDDVGPESADTSSVTAVLTSRQRRVLWTLIGVAVAAALVSLGLTIDPLLGSSDAANWTGDAAVLAAPLLCFWRAAVVPLERVAWLLIGAGMLCWGAGDCYFNVALAGLQSPPAPSWADAGYLLFYPLAGVGLLLQIRHAAGRFPDGFVLDWLVGALSVVAIMSALVFPKVLTTAGGDLPQVITNLAYPIGDLVLLTLLVGALQLNGWQPRGVWALFGLGLMLTVAGDGVYLYQTAAGTYLIATPLDSLWTFGFLAMGLAAWRPVPTRLKRASGKWSTSGPLAVFALGALAIVIWDHFHALTITAVVLAALTLLAVFVRLLKSLATNRQLVVERERQALTDEVTGLANHRALNNVLRTELQRSLRYDRGLGILFIDLDFFKSINDRYGHDAGDRTLGEFCEVVTGALRRIDRIGRWGGEEFIAVLPDTDLPEAIETAERIREEVAQHRFAAIDGAGMTCSIGVAAFPGHGQSHDALLKRADLAMYEAKRSGRDRVVATGTSVGGDTAALGRRAAARPAGAGSEPHAALPSPGRQPGGSPSDSELDPIELQFRLDTVPAPVWTTALMCLVAFGYAAVAARPQSRIALIALGLLVLAFSLAMLALPWPRIVRSRFRPAVAIGWWAFDFAAVLTAVMLDGGPQSPFVLLMFALLVVMGYSEPRSTVATLSSVCLIGYAALALAYGQEPARAALVLASLAATAAMSYGQSVNQDRRHRALLASRHDLEIALRRSESSQRALKESEQRLSEAQAIAHIGSLEWDVADNRLAVSAETLRILGLRWEEFDSTLDGYLARVHPGDRDEVAQMIRDELRISGPFRKEHRIVRPDGAVRLLLIHGDSLFEHDGPARVRAVCQDLTELRAFEARVQHLSDHDPLTGLFSRRRLIDEMDRELRHPTRRDRAGVLLLVDVDGFGFYNDSFGQSAGDDLLRAIATALSDELRATYVVARCGGDEFAAVLPGIEERDAVGIGEALRMRAAGCAPGTPISVSIGIAPFRQGTSLLGDDVLAAADIALHEAKEGGGNRVAVYRGQPGADMSWVQQVRTALQEGRFVLFGQPIVDLATGRQSYIELLIRLLSDDGRLIGPGAFLPSAERFGLIKEIDRWVLTQAIGFAQAGQRVAVNLSAHSIGDAQLVGTVREAIAAGLDPANLAFEITETAAVTNLAEARAFAGELTGLGCELAIDDFGTGFASFTYLKHIPAQYVKIDMEFIKDLASSETDRHVVSSIVDVTRSLGKRTIAEGVEDAATLAAVRELGVDFAQGYHTGRPRRLSPPTEFEQRSAEPVAAAPIG
jgi:diguanylate cyclase (GGDEF)-like protein/PAS domain S-box-containing protein